MTEETKEVTFNTLGDAINFVEERGRSAQDAAQGFERAFVELVGFPPQRHVNALDVVKICYSLYGEPPKHD